MRPFGSVADREQQNVKGEERTITTQKTLVKPFPWFRLLQTSLLTGMQEKKK